MMCKLMNSSLGRSGFEDKHVDRASWGAGRGRLSMEGSAGPRAAVRGCLSLQSEEKRSAWEPPRSRRWPTFHSVLWGPPHPSSAPPTAEFSPGWGIDSWCGDAARRPGQGGELRSAERRRAGGVLHIGTERSSHPEAATFRALTRQGGAPSQERV